MEKKMETTILYRDYTGIIYGLFYASKAMLSCLMRVTLRKHFGMLRMVGRSCGDVEDTGDLRLRVFVLR